VFAFCGTSLERVDITHKVTAQSFGGAFTIIEVGLPPGAMIPPHTHAREDERTSGIRPVFCPYGGAYCRSGS
jgi:hypothetical protein